MSPPAIASSTAAPGVGPAHVAVGDQPDPGGLLGRDDLGDQPLDRRVRPRGAGEVVDAGSRRRGRAARRPDSIANIARDRTRRAQPQAATPSIQSRPKNTREADEPADPDRPGPGAAEHRHGRARASRPGRTHIERSVGTRVGASSTPSHEARHEAADVGPVVDVAEDREAEDQVEDHERDQLAR